MRSFYLDIDDIERLVSYSNQLGVSASRIVREALKKTLDEMEETGEVSPIKKRDDVGVKTRQAKTTSNSSEGKVI